MRRTLILLLVFAWGAAAGAQIPNPLRRLPRLDRIPGLDRILDNPPLTTTTEDAWLEAPPLDGWSPASFAPLLAQPRDEDGAFVLHPGAYAMDAESYCLQIASRGPVDGDGFFNAPLEGARAGVVRSILRGAASHPDIPQGDIQVLLWALLARAEVDDLNPRLRSVAARLLTADELRSVSSSAWDLLDSPAGRRAIRELPQPAQRVLAVERQVLGLVGDAQYDYGRLERLVMTPVSVVSNEEPRTIPAGRWMHHPEGFFIRYASSYYRRTRVEVYVPERFTVRRDSLGRILSIKDPRGNGTETDYDDTIEPLTVPGDPGLRGYRFRSIRFVRATPSGVERHEIRGRGWTFVRGRARPSRNNWPAMSIMPAAFRAPMRRQMSFERWQERAKQAREHYERFDYYRDRAESLRNQPDESAIDDLENMEHYRDGVDAALGGDTGERLEWITEQQERQRDALRHAITVIDTLPTESTTDNPSYAPWNGAAVPARSGGQRLGISGRGR